VLAVAALSSTWPCEGRMQFFLVFSGTCASNSVSAAVGNGGRAPALAAATTGSIGMP
jgi:hypothetical protein